MDLSEEYIWMCIMAKEVQELWKPKVGDHAKHGNHVVGTYVMQYADWKEGKADIEGLMWLPRQDQLQEMISNFYHEQEQYKDMSQPEIFGFWNFESWMEKKYTKEPGLGHFPTETFNTLEQCLLGCVMQLKYNKKWNGQDWEEMK
jgi:hypothetical protein